VDYRILWSQSEEAHEMEWTEETVAKLRALWDEGLSTAEIGRRLGVSKNAVVGKAHRLDLPPRPSPIRRGEGGPRAPRPPRRVSGPTLPPLAGVPRQAAPRPVMPPVASVAPRPPQPAPRPVAVPPRPIYVGRITTCCWPIGEPGTPSFRFCDADALPGKPYCEAHAQVAYVRIRDRREDAA
jgi:GcrA cell cycle regulator